MPVLSVFYGLIVRMYFYDDKQHHTPHIHVDYQGQQAVFAIANGDVLAGDLPVSKMKLVAAWVEIHRDELLANWTLAVSGEQPVKIEPLR